MPALTLLDEDTRLAARGHCTERRLALGFALTLALLLGILGLRFWQGNDFVSSEWWADHIILLSVGALCAAFLTASFIISRRELRRRRALGASLARANAGLSAEVAERRRAEASLHESEARFRRIANNVPGMVCRFKRHADGTMALPFVSEGCRRICGLEPAEMQGNARLLLARVHPADRPGILRTIQAAVKAAGPWKWQGRIVRFGTGETRYVEALFQPERQPDGELVWDGVLVDVTERRQADDLVHAKQAAERTNQEKSRFLSRVSHELRTPLNAILGFGQLMELSPLETRDRESLDYMLRGARHLLSLVDEVLDLSRAETGDLQLSLARVDPDAVAGECVGLLSTLAQKHGVACAARRSAAPMVLRCDEQRLRQVLFNLLSNAIKYNRPGGAVQVWCEEAPGGRRRVKVRDTGPGIPSAGMKKLFLPFERLEHEDGGVEGTGLGLAVSRRLAEAMGGTVGVESTVGAGSTFWIELPAADERSETDRPAPVASLDTAAGGVAARVPASARVLYIEDNESNLRAIERLLGRLRPQWHLLTAGDGERGLELARHTLPDVILLDRHLPGMMGDEVLAELRAVAATQHIPVIVLSADATDDSRDDLLARGADGYLSKPFEMQTLLRTVEKALTKKVAC